MAGYAEDLTQGEVWRTRHGHVVQIENMSVVHLLEALTWLEKSALFDPSTVRSTVLYQALRSRVAYETAV